MLRVGGRTYLYLSRESFRFYRRSHDVPASVCAVACGKYIVVPGGAFSSLSLNRLGRLFDRNAPKASKRTGQAVKNRRTGKETPVPRVSLTRFEGQPAWELIAGKVKIFIAEHGGYLLGMSKPKFGAFRFSEWNAVPPIRAPRPNQVFGLG